MKSFTIASAYQWSKKDNNYKNLTSFKSGAAKSNKMSNSELAIKHIFNMIKRRFENKRKNDFSYNINYRKIRASAGRTMLDSIINRIETTEVIIIDITEKNPNVFIELGIALYNSKKNRYPSVYLIKDITSNENIMQDLPSDLQGYFVSGYKMEKGKVVFKDQNSLRMSIESDVKEYFNELESKKFNQINEIDHN